MYYTNALENIANMNNVVNEIILLRNHNFCFHLTCDNCIVFFHFFSYVFRWKSTCQHFSKEQWDGEQEIGRKWERNKMAYRANN